jgi:hypothetical protein
MKVKLITKRVQIYFKDFMDKKVGASLILPNI